jgi:hypothetical protein
MSKVEKVKTEEPKTDILQAEQAKSELAKTTATAESIEAELPKLPKPIYTEAFTARVNYHKASKTEEVILRGVDSVHILALRPMIDEQGKFETGKVYRIAIIEQVIEPISDIAE